MAQPKRTFRWSDELHESLRRLADHIRAQGPQGATKTSPSTVARALITEGLERWRHRSHCEVERGDAGEIVRVVSLGVESFSLEQLKPGQWDLELRLGDGSVRRLVVLSNKPARTSVLVKELQP